MNCLNKIRLFISPCPNDTFVFYGLIAGIVDCEGLTFDVGFEDIESLNGRLARNDGDVIKASVAMAGETDYHLLSSGAALGRGNGPVVVRGSAKNGVVALPGRHTTARLLFNRFFDGYQESYFTFSDVATAVKSGAAELGVLIHEGRFTYASHNLEFVADLGLLWEDETGLPLPLGAIFASPKLDDDIRRAVERTIKRSVQWAIGHRADVMDFVKSHAQELSDSVVNSHIDCFVNRYTIDLDLTAKRALTLLSAVPAGTPRSECGQSDRSALEL